MEPLRTTATFDPARVDFESYGLTCVHWQPSRMRRPDHHNEIELNFLESGSVTYLLAGQKVSVDAGRLSVFWGAFPHQIVDFGNAPAYFVATIPLPWLLQWRLPGDFVRALLQGRMLVESDGARAVYDAENFQRWESDLLAGQADQEQSVLLEMEARLLRLADSQMRRNLPLAAERRAARRLGAGLSHAERMACFVAEHYSEPLTIQRIAKSVDLHPNYAMNLFQRTFGATLVDYITKYRVSHAQRILVTTDHKIVDVAFESGFSSLSRFNEAFRQICGCSPRSYRQSHLPD